MRMKASTKYGVDWALLTEAANGWPITGIQTILLQELRDLARQHTTLLQQQLVVLQRMDRRAARLAARERRR